METPTTDSVVSQCSELTGDIDFSDFAKMHSHAMKLEIAIREILKTGECYDEFAKAREIAEEALK